MSIDKITEQVKEDGKHMYEKYGDDPQALSRHMWEEIGRLGHNKELVSKPQTRKDVEQAFLEAVVKESKEHHKTTYVEFTDPYNSCAKDKNHIKVGSNDGYINNDMKDLKEFPKSFTADEIQLGKVLYRDLGAKHNDIAGLQHHLNTETVWNAQSEKAKTARDHAMQSFAEHNNYDKNSPYHFSVSHDAKHNTGFDVTDKKTGKPVGEIRLHDDRY